MTNESQMISLLDVVFENTLPDDNGWVPPFNPGRIQFVNTGRQQYYPQVPIHLRIFRRVNKPRECVVCNEKYVDFEIKSEASATITGEGGFDKNWIWPLLHFPNHMFIPGCTHEFDVCKTCYAKHLNTQLQMLGQVRCEKLLCPHPPCSRVLNYSDVWLLATRETFNL